MNDYVGTSHEAITAWSRRGQPGQAQAWAGKVSAVSRKIGVSVADLRQQWPTCLTTWSDGSGRSADGKPRAVTDYLETLSEHLAGQPGSYADLVAEVAVGAQVLRDASGRWRATRSLASCEPVALAWPTTVTCGRRWSACRAGSPR